MCWKLVLLSLIFVFSLVPKEVNAFGHQMKTISQGGPFIAKRKWTQHFAGKFTLSASDSKKPMMLVLHNGFGDSPGFKWLRVFLCGDIETNLGKFEEPQGDLVFDENYVQKHTISIDVTDLVEEGVNTVYIEAIGKKGSVLSYTLASSVSPQLAVINPTQTHQGAKLTLTGKGFSSDLGENNVSADGHDFEVVESSRTRLTVRVPLNMNAGEAILKVTTNGIESESIPITILPTPIMKSLSQSMVNNSVFEITGRNLAGDQSKTEVYLGSFRAKILSEDDSKITFGIPSELYSSAEKAFRVQVVVDGVMAQGNLVYTQ